MRHILQAGETITAVMSGAAATTNPTYFADQSTGSLSGATAVTLASGACVVNSIVICNVDTAAVTITLKKLLGSTAYTFAVVTLQVSDVLTIDDRGMRVTDTSGQLKQTATSTTVVPVSIDATHWRKTDGVTLNTGSAATTNFGVVYGTDGTDFPHLETIDSKNATTVVVSRCIVRLPSNYVAGSAITLRALAGMKTTVASNSAATTLGFNVYSNAGAGNLGSADINATAAQSINSLTLANKDFTITPTGLVAGQDLHIKMTLTVTDSATGTAVIGTVNHVELRCSVSQ